MIRSLRRPAMESSPSTSTPRGPGRGSLRVVVPARQKDRALGAAGDEELAVDEHSEVTGAQPPPEPVREPGAEGLRRLLRPIPIALRHAAAGGPAPAPPRGPGAEGPRPLPRPIPIALRHAAAGHPDLTHRVRRTGHAGARLHDRDLQVREHAAAPHQAPPVDLAYHGLLTRTTPGHHQGRLGKAIAWVHGTRLEAGWSEGLREPG